MNNPGVYVGNVWTTPFGVYEEGGVLQSSPTLMPEMWPVEYVKFY